jgi:Kef-type K+ transport system membrane component KefB
MNEILSVGLILLAAVAAGHLAQRVRVPEVTGYLLVGAALGPGVLDVVSAENREALQFLSEVALGLILFSIGAFFEAPRMVPLGRRVLLLTLAEAGAAAVLVSAGMLTLGLSRASAALLGIIAMETAPATTLMVLREYDAQGPLTDMVIGMLALNNMLVLIAFGVASAIIGHDAAAPAASASAGVFGAVWGIVGSIALGALLGVTLDAWTRRVKSAAELSVLGLGVLLVAVGAARWLSLSSLVTTLVLGATMANASERCHELLGELRQVEPPFYAAFFVLAGAELRPEMLAGIGTAGLLYVGLRSTGKVAGTRLAGRLLEVPDLLRRHLGLCLISSSSLAIGLTIQIRERFPAETETVTGIVLAGVIVFEIAGPLLARRALFSAGETTGPAGDLSPVAAAADPAVPVR